MEAGCEAHGRNRGWDGGSIHAPTPHFFSSQLDGSARAKRRWKHGKKWKKGRTWGLLYRARGWGLILA